MDVNINELLYMARLNDQYAIWKLWEYYQGICRMLAIETKKKYPDMYVSEEELIDEARCAMFLAIEDYRYDCNANFSTYITIVMKRAMRNVIRKLKCRTFERRHNLLTLDNQILENYVAIEEKDDTLLYRISFLKTLPKLTEKENKVIMQYMQGIPRRKAMEQLHMSGKAYDSALLRVKSKMQKTHSYILNHQDEYFDYQYS